ncbi:uncharacterized protein LOC100745664 isoform X1 [Bombus impatiens]|uniref:Uncharacterized protein LOC100745664 isoform X1 n=1 Tax=Bombus impatiens TaxID=132113 RepID=A0A6P8LG44_BOMIM|nr:uncharacterized protein LOC100745664 isoform X1 [Bombus impatiens]
MMLPVYLLMLQQINYLNHLSSVEQTIIDVLRRIKFSDVQLVAQNPYGNNLGIINEIYKIVAQTIPTSYISVNDSDPLELSSSQVSQATLILYIYIGKTSPNFEQTENIIRAIVSKNRPKILLITMMEEADCNFEPLLKQTWHNHWIDIEILELSKLNRHTIAAKVHRYNPFTNVYDQRPYVSGIELFPNKVDNLYGYPIKIGMLKRPGYLWYTKNSQGYPVMYRGPDVKLIKTLARIMNFTIAVYPSKDLFADIIDEKIDMIIPTLSLFADVNAVKCDFTLPSGFESWCPVVPVKYKSNHIEIRGLIGIATNFCVLLIFWGLSVVLKFQSDLWQPLKIFGLLIATSISSRPKKTTERIIFFLIVLASSMYSANLFIDLTNISMKEHNVIDYNSYKELDDAGLTPVILVGLFNVTFLNEDESFFRLKRKAIQMDNIESCVNYLEQHNNITCFLETRNVNMIIYSHAREGKKVLKNCEKLCYAKPPSAYFLKKHSPYKDQFVKTIIRLDAAGIRMKWLNDYIGKFRPRKTHIMEVNSSYISPLVWNLAYITCSGFLMSLLAFFGEIIIHYLRRDKGTKRFLNRS